MASKQPFCLSPTTCSIILFCLNYVYDKFFLFIPSTSKSSHYDAQLDWQTDQGKFCEKGDWNA
jgi:hypothetical protein